MYKCTNEPPTPPPPHTHKLLPMLMNYFFNVDILVILNKRLRFFNPSKNNGF